MWPSENDGRKEGWDIKKKGIKGKDNKGQQETARRSLELGRIERTVRCEMSYTDMGRTLGLQVMDCSHCLLWPWEETERIPPTHRCPLFVAMPKPTLQQP